MSIKVEGITLKVSDYRETSKIIRILTRENGLLSILIKGARKVNSKHKEIAQPLVLGCFHLPKTEGLINVYKAERINFYKNIKCDFYKMTYSTHMIELVLQYFESEKSDSDVYDLLLRALDSIESGKDAEIISFIFELQMLKFIGVNPQLSFCVRCGKQENITTFDIDSGGLVCSDCLTSNDNVFDINIVKLLKLLSQVKLENIGETKVSESNRYYLRKILSEYYNKYTGMKSNSLKTLEEISKYKL